MRSNQVFSRGSNSDFYIVENTAESLKQQSKVSKITALSDGAVLLKEN